MKLNAPRIGHALRRAGLSLCRFARHFTPPSEERKFLDQLLAGVEWHRKLSPLTDKEIAAVAAETMPSFPWDSKEDSVMTEIVTRLSRSEGGANYGDEERT